MELVIDTASGALSVALIDGPAVIAEHHAVIGRGHAETVVAFVAAIVGDRGADIRGIVVDTGPGSFTGVRIGVAAARALGLAWDVPVHGVSALALIAAGAFAGDAAETVVAIADAGRGRLYRQAFGRARCRPLDAATVTAVADVVVPPGALIAGTGATALPGRRSAVTHPRASDLRWLPATARGAATPLYLGGAELAA